MVLYLLSQLLIKVKMAAIIHFFEKGLYKDKSDIRYF